MSTPVVSRFVRSAVASAASALVLATPAAALPVAALPMAPPPPFAPHTTPAGAAATGDRGPAPRPRRRSRLRRPVRRVIAELPDRDGSVYRFTEVRGGGEPDAELRALAVHQVEPSGLEIERARVVHAVDLRRIDDLLAGLRAATVGGATPVGAAAWMAALERALAGDTEAVAPVAAPAPEPRPLLTGTHGAPAGLAGLGGRARALALV